jgi:hypothetical protein
MNQVNLNDEIEIFDYLLNRKENNIDEEYFNIINEIEKDISSKLSLHKISNLYEGNINFDNNEWINEKYKKLINNQITQDLITDNILSFYEKKLKLKSNLLNIETNGTQ